MQDVRAAPEGGLLEEDLRFAIESEAAGYATAPQLELLEANRPQWREGLRRLLNDPAASVKIEYLQRELRGAAAQRTEYSYPGKRIARGCPPPESKRSLARVV